MPQAPTQLSRESWLDAALAGATVQEIRDDDDALVGWWAENAGWPGASAYGASPEEVRAKLREVLAGWVELGQELNHPIPSIPESNNTATA